MKRSPSQPTLRPVRWSPGCSEFPNSAWVQRWLFAEAISSGSEGFSRIADYIADDYQLGHKLHALGLRNIISEVVVSTRLASGSWLGAWRHQVRWARTIRLSGGRAGYAGLPITYASLWAAIAALFGLWWIALPLLAVRIFMAMVCGGLLLGSADVWKYCYAIPLRDLCGVAVWAAGLFGHTVIWRNQKVDARRGRRRSFRTSALL